MRLKAILADDEAIIVRNLQAVIPWNELGIDVVGTAKNGVEALELCRVHEPDLVLSDIRMPQMDGITFVERLREWNEYCEIVMVTGYQDFEYARSLLRFGVSDYVLKPIHYEALEQSIAGLAETIRERKRTRRSEAQKWNQAFRVAYEKLLFDVLMDYSTVLPKTVLPTDELDLEGMSYIVCLVDVDGYSQKSLSWKEEERKLWNFAVRNVLQEQIAADSPRSAVLQIREGEWCLLLERGSAAAETEKAEDAEPLRRLAAELQSAVERNVKLSVSVGFLPRLVGLHELAGAYKLLQRTVQLGAGEPKAVRFAKEQREPSDSNLTVWHLVEEMVNGLKACSRPRTEEALTRLRELLESLPVASFDRAFQMLHFLILHMLREMREMSSLDGPAEERMWTQLDQCKSLADLLRVMTGLMEYGLEGTNKKKNSELLMEAAKTYIHANYAADFGIEDIADSLGISCSYFSLLFKQHFGETFVEYLTRHRMELAQSMLLLSDKSVTEIGRAVGYAERRYFTKVFQKFTGEIPSEFREKRKPV
ncbi:response regulator [Paenibacillus athensensis]|nr:response regulator [Paenibacillus athensensis]MCD1258303.1 response regulator [Paenibacillus athensensis]